MNKSTNRWLALWLALSLLLPSSLAVMAHASPSDPLLVGLEVDAVDSVPLPADTVPADCSSVSDAPANCPWCMGCAALLTITNPDTLPPMKEVPALLVTLPHWINQPQDRPPRPLS